MARGLSMEEVVNDKARQPRDAKVKELSDFVRNKLTEILAEANRLEISVVADAHARVIPVGQQQFVHIYFDMAVEDK